MVDFCFKEHYKMQDLVEIMQLLRSPDGCPWDREQTHSSIRKNLIEETYEAVEAIDLADPVLLREELGDVLLQVVFHAQLEAEAGSFDLDDVADGICKKLIIRHPHIFGNVTVKDTGEVLSNWDEIKKATKGQKTQTETMLSVPLQLPALMRSQKVQQKASKVGYDWESVQGALDKLKEEIEELQAAALLPDKEALLEEMGDVLFSAVNVSRLYGLDAEEALTAATDKFISRFRLVEQIAAERGIRVEQASPSVLDVLWEEAKKLIQSQPPAGGADE